MVQKLLYALDWLVFENGMQAHYLRNSGVTTVLPGARRLPSHSLHRPQPDAMEQSTRQGAARPHRFQH